MNTTTEPMAFDLRRNPHGRLVLRLADGTEHEAVTPVRAFPIAAPQEGLSLEPAPLTVSEAEMVLRGRLCLG